MNGNPKAKELKEKANSLPLTPGVYIMKNKAHEIIYVGKAKALKNRVTQYFGSGNNHNAKVSRMVSQVDTFDYILCDSEFEAFILENSLIKQHQPKYNILLKDDKGYHYIRITDEKWKRIEFSNDKNGSGKYIGPYNSGAVVKSTIDEARKLFKLPSCSRSFEKKSKPCLNYHIGICDAPCAGKISNSEYLKNVSSAISFIKNGGFSEKEIAEMEEKMIAAAEKEEFEYAALLRDRIKYVKQISQKQKVITDDSMKQDVFTICAVGSVVCVEILVFRGGHLSDEKHYIYNNVENKDEFLSEFISRYYDKSTDLPKRILLENGIEDGEIIEKWLTEKSGRAVKLVIPQIGELKKTVDMCKNNANYNLTLYLEPKGREKATLTELSNLLGLEKMPEYIEAYDISNIAGSENVAGMVVFKSTKPQKNLYRKFRIKSFIGQDDFRSMAEVLQRRFNEYKKGSDVSFSRLPDLILLDGGKGQLSAVMKVLESEGITVPVFGMVKDSKHRTKAICTLNGEIDIKPTKRVFTFITQIQDEVHRYAISFHKARRTKSMIKSELTEIDGVGIKRAENLIKYFKTIDAIKKASVEELKKAPAMSEKSAINVYKYYN